MRFLLDTNIVSHLVREPHGEVAERVLSVDDSQLCTSVIVAAELWFGVTKRDSRRLRTNLEKVLSSLQVLPLEPPVDTIYGRIRTDLEANGQPVGSNDLFIAAQALAIGLTIVTDNVREFSRIDGLSVENWLRP
jgi:tRNA(fMet)-specific endonuclease VapC